MLHVDPHLKEHVRKQIEERGQRTGPAKRPITTVKGSAVFDLQFRAQVEGHSFISDERQSAGGHDAGPAPMRYFVAGLMMCHKVWTVKTAALMDLQLESLEGDISWFADEPIPRIVYNIQIKSANSDGDMIKIVQGGASGCPAFQAMERAARIEVTIKHNDKLIHEQVFGVK
jgi:uncharacterized OsmC-like protein